MKKTILIISSFVLAILLVLSFSSCNKNTTKTPTPEKTEITSAPEKTETVVNDSVFPNNPSNLKFKANDKFGVYLSTSEGDYKYIVGDAQFVPLDKNIAFTANLSTIVKGFPYDESVGKGVVIYFEVTYDQILKADKALFSDHVGSNDFEIFIDGSDDKVKTIEFLRPIDITAEPTEDPFGQFAKPVIYFYPTTDTLCSCNVILKNGEFTCTYPAYGDGWKNFVASPDGTLTFEDGRQYYALYWEANTIYNPDLSHGFCVKREETAEFLESALSSLGLNFKERNEFIMYWLPKLTENEYNLISFDCGEYENMSALEISPKPDSILRVFMTVKASDTFVEMTPEVYKPFERNGFTVVEWGGTIIE